MEQGDEAKRFLQDFLARLMEANETNKSVVEANNLLLRQVARNAEATAALARNVVLLVRKVDELSMRMDALGHLLVEDDTGAVERQTRGIPFGVVGEHLRDRAGRWVGQQIQDAFFPHDGHGR